MPTSMFLLPGLSDCKCFKHMYESVDCANHVFIMHKTLIANCHLLPMGRLARVPNHLQHAGCRNLAERTAIEASHGSPWSKRTRGIRIPPELPPGHIIINQRAARPRCREGSKRQTTTKRPPLSHYMGGKATTPCTRTQFPLPRVMEMYYGDLYVLVYVLPCRDAEMLDANLHKVPAYN